MEDPFIGTQAMCRPCWVSILLMFGLVVSVRVTSKARADALLDDAQAGVFPELSSALRSRLESLRHANASCSSVLVDDIVSGPSKINPSPRRPSRSEDAALSRLPMELISKVIQFSDIPSIIAFSATSRRCAIVSKLAGLRLMPFDPQVSS